MYEVFPVLFIYLFFIFGVNFLMVISVAAFYL